MHVTYEEQLKQPEWLAKRQQFLGFDGVCCNSCGKTRYQIAILELHHRYYQRCRMAWQYPDQAFLVLCRRCHQGLHDQLGAVPIFDELGRLVEQPRGCSRCGGSGFIPPYHHVQNGICFGCWGAGVPSLDLMLLTIEEFLAKNLKEPSGKLSRWLQPLPLVNGTLGQQKKQLRAFSAGKDR